MAKAFVLALLTIAVLATGARATDVDTLVGVLTDIGHTVVEEAADDGPNLVVDNGDWSISLADCTDRANCSHGWIYARRKLEHFLYADCANDWNGQEPFGTAWIDNVSQPWLVTTINLRGEPGAAAIRSSLEWYATQLRRFEAYIETCPPIDRERR